MGSGGESDRRLPGRIAVVICAALACASGVTRASSRARFRTPPRDESEVLAVLTQQAGRRIFCASGAAAPTRGLCTPRRLRRWVRQISAGEVYEVRGSSQRGGGREPEKATAGTSQRCQGASRTHAFTPQQLSTAYGVDELHSRGLDGSGVRVATLSSQEVDTAGFKTWARCFGLRTPVVRQFAMPGASPDTATAPEETVLDVEALASLAPGLQFEPEDARKGTDEEQNAGAPAQVRPCGAQGGAADR